jgi:ribonucleoside-diphosphate reductase alpha chain
LPRNDHSYIQAPFEECSREKFEQLYMSLKDVDLTKVIEEVDNTDLSGEVACANGVCELV